MRVIGNTLTFHGKTYRCAVGKGGFSAHKKEGDGATPLGTFALRECWVRADKMDKPQTKLPLRIIQPDDGWCDDPQSRDYNRHIRLLSSPSPLRGEGRGGGASLLRYAKNLRSNMTEAEKLLWYHLRAHRFADYGFRRQRPMGGKYIADFVCPEKKLILEIDGGQHAESTEDRQRDAFLLHEGYRVMRFWNNEVLENTEGVLTVILQELRTPSLTLPPQGGGDKKGYENLWREDDVYDLVIVLGYNDDPVVAGAGSAIFMHVAKPDYAPTEGCIALSKSDWAAILPAIDANTRIHIEEQP